VPVLIFLRCRCLRILPPPWARIFLSRVISLCASVDLAVLAQAEVWLLGLVLSPLKCATCCAPALCFILRFRTYKCFCCRDSSSARDLLPALFPARSVSAVVPPPAKSPARAPESPSVSLPARVRSESFDLCALDWIFRLVLLWLMCLVLELSDQKNLRFSSSNHS
jgi:hypothetical protein